MSNSKFTLNIEREVEIYLSEHALYKLAKIADTCIQLQHIHVL